MDDFHLRRAAQRRSAQASPHSGLSGDPKRVDPTPPAPRRTLAERLRGFRDVVRATFIGIPQVARLVWKTSPALTTALFAATVLAGLLPALNAYTAKLLINAVVRAIQVHQQHIPDRTQLQVQLLFVDLRSPLTTTIGAIAMLAGVQFVIYAFTSLLSTVRNVSQQLMQDRVQLQIQLMVMEHAARLDLQFFESSDSYDLLRRAQQDSSSRPVVMVSTMFGLLQTTLTFASMVALLIGVSPILALVALLSPIPAFISDTRYGWRGYQLARWASPLRRRMSYLVDLVTTDSYTKEIKLFDLGGYFIARFKALSKTYYERQRRLVGRRYMAGYAWSSITTLAGSATYLYVAIKAVFGPLTLGDLTLYTQAASSVQSSIQGILSGFSGMYENSLYLANLYELLATPVMLAPPAHPVEVTDPIRGEVVFEHVTFQYPGSNSIALEDVSFRISAGETIAVVGRNGAGKSTLIKLLCRLYDPTSGRVLLDGHDLKDYDPTQLRGAIAAMFQDFVTYQATAAENIGLGDLNRIEDLPAIREAAAKSGADAVVDRLAMGYDSPLGRWFEGGVNLSGGEWQKLALGRAFLRDASVMVLDEPTSALDAQAEFELFGRLRQLSAGRTAVYISHRFSTVRQADRILFLEGGRLIEEGTHATLMALAGRYAALFNMQASAYADLPLEEGVR
ncbi:MAG TPA: ABC transporter ATP-binding protein [Candidatus Nitrosotalea sp.]|nr:ABC transporter ATP-binding protein [Candidatus Nitrosotalea sp.]